MNGEVPHLYTIPSISFRACAFVGILLNLLSPVQIGDVKKNYIDTNRKYVSDGGRTEGKKFFCLLARLCLTSEFFSLCAV